VQFENTTIQIDQTSIRFSMHLSLGMITIVVDDYDLAISHFVNDLGFTLIEDSTLSADKRWVVVAPGIEGAKILLAKASNSSQKASIGNSTGGRVGFFLYTSDFGSTYQQYLLRNIEFTELPRSESFGRVVVFKDAYGNKWDLIERKAAPNE
jgi:catechol 2,3-dioxygenase-like lactoylglutathione lyase family enzyme